MGLDIFENEGISEKKGCVEIEDWGLHLYTLDWGCKKILFTLYSYVLAEILQNSAKFRYAEAGFKNYYNTTPCISLAQTLHTFHKCSPSKCKFSEFSTVQVKVHQIPHAIFQIKSQFFFKVWIFFQCHER